MPVNASYIDQYKVKNTTNRLITLGDLVNVIVPGNKTIDLLSQPRVTKDKINQSKHLQIALKKGLLVFIKDKINLSSNQKEAVLASLNDEMNLDIDIANFTSSGITVNFMYGQALSTGDIVYYGSNQKVYPADADGTSNTFPAIGIAVESASSGEHPVLLKGLYRNDLLFNWTVGSTIYLSLTAGLGTHTQPSATDNVIQVIGTAIKKNIMYVNPSADYMTHV